MNSLAGQNQRNSSFALPPAWADATALIAGLVLPFAFAPFYLFPLAILCPAALFFVWQTSSPGRAAFRGFLFGLGLFGVGVSWVYVSMHLYGNMPGPLAAFAVLLFVAGLSVYPALTGFIQARLFSQRGSWHLILIIPVLWVLFEWLRGWIFTGFPWLNLGYSQMDTPLSGYAAWLGVYGVSLACAITAGLLVDAIHARAGIFRRTLPLLVVLWAMGLAAGFLDWTKPVGESLRVTLVQANVPLERKWRPENRRGIMNRYWSLSAQAPPSNFIVWPEAAIPAFLDEIDPEFLEQLREQSRSQGMDFLIGVLERDAVNRKYYNAVLGIGSKPGIYRKQHLVPFGEYPPLDPLFRWLMQHFRIPMSDFSAGARGQPLLTAAGHAIGVSVCYEDAFGEEVIRSLPHAALLVNVSEDAWFGDSLAPHQRLQMARMRALESGRGMVRAANSGPSAVIDHRGQVVATIPQFQTRTLTAPIQPREGMTPYARSGNWVLVPLLILVLILFGLRARNQRATL